MKKLILILLALLVFQVKAQDKSRILGDSIVWFGIDFTKARMIGEFSNLRGIDDEKPKLKDGMIPAWNTLILNEQKKYDICKFFHKRSVYFDMNPVTKNNSLINETQLINPNEYTFKNPDETIAEVLKALPEGEKSSGLGLIFVVESFNKVQDLSNIYVTFFDIASKQLIYSQKISKKPHGGGLRNYWAGSIFDTMKSVDEDFYSTWKKQFKTKK
ncbi:MAG: hypothetical protein ACXVPN_01400 [Bacteroidia bacterium]